MDSPQLWTLPFSSEDEEEDSFQTLAAGYQLLADGGGLPGDASPDSVTEALLADLCHSSSSSEPYESGGDEAAGQASMDGAAVALSADLMDGSDASSQRSGSTKQQQQAACTRGHCPSGYCVQPVQVSGGTAATPGLHNSEEASSTPTASSPAHRATFDVATAHPPTGSPAAAAPAPPEPPSGQQQQQRKEEEGKEGGAGLDAERHAAILAAMQRVQLDYRPPWAEVLPEERWMRRLQRRRQRGEPAA